MIRSGRASSEGCTPDHDHHNPRALVGVALWTTTVAVLAILTIAAA